MSELENIIRKIIREEIQQYFKKAPMTSVVVEETHDVPVKEPEEDKFELFEKRYQEALKIDDEVREKYKEQTDKYGPVISLEDASKILSMSVYTIRKIAKTDKNFPPIGSRRIDTARLMHWLDGGKGYWNLLRDEDD